MSAPQDVKGDEHVHGEGLTRRDEAVGVSDLGSDRKPSVSPLPGVSSETNKSAVPLVQHLGTHTETPASYSTCHDSHEQGGLCRGDPGAGRGASEQLDGSRAEGTPDRASGVHGSPAREEELHALQVPGGGDEPSQQEEVRTPGFCQGQDGRPCEWQRNHSSAPEVLSLQSLHDESSHGNRPGGIWHACSFDLRGGAPLARRLHPVGHEHSLGRTLRLPPEPPSSMGQHDAGEGCRSPHAQGYFEAEGKLQEGHECSLSRIRDQHRIECGDDPDDQSPSGRGVGAPSGTPSQEDGQGGRHHERSLLLRCDPSVGEHGAHADVADDLSGSEYSKLSQTWQSGMSGVWEQLPEHKCKKLSQKANRLVPDAFNALVSSGRTKLLEIACSPDSILTETMNESTKSEMSGRRCSLFNGYDLSTNQGIHGVIREIESCKPEHVWMSPICGPYSVMQNINQRDEAQKERLGEKRREALKQYVGCSLIYTYCIQRGIHATWEWSQSCQAWRLPLMQKLVQRFQPFFAIIRGCRVGLTTKEGEPISKGWKIMTTHALLAKRMNMPCVCKSGTPHVKCEGKLTNQTAYYTKQFAKRVCDALLQGCEESDLVDTMEGHSPLPDLFGIGSSCNCVEGKHHEANLLCGNCALQAQNMVRDTCCSSHVNHEGLHEHVHEGLAAGEQEESLENPENPEGDGGNPQELSREKIQQKLYLLHASTGHGPIRHLVQALKRRGVSARVMEEAEKFSCPVCHERQRPKPRPLASLEPLPPKWSTVASDLGTWEHPQTGKSYQFLLMIDEGSRFRIGRIMGEGKRYHTGASQFLETFGESWSQYFGQPHTLRLDPDGSFRSTAVEEYCDRHGIFLDIIPGESHWKLGICEGAIEGIKELMTRLAMDDPEITPQLALFEATRTFNEREFVRGFSPIQHALGRTPDPCDRLFPAAIGDCPELLVENANGEMSRNLQRMKTAQDAFLDWTNTQRLQRASNSKARTLQSFEPGDLVYVWRKQVSGQSTVKGGAFVGPARILAIENRISEDGTRKESSSAWCVRGRRLWKCSVEQLRKASSKETIMAELQDDSSESWDFRQAVSALGKNEFLDITEEVPTAEEWTEGQDPQLAWQPVHRHRGKRPPSPGMLLPMEVEASGAPTSSSRGPRSRSPVRGSVRTRSSAPDVAMSAAEPWWKSSSLQSSFSATSCPHWTNQMAAVAIEIPMPETRSASEKAVADFPAFFSSSLKRRSSIEVHEKHLTAEEKEQFRQAKSVEVNNFIASAGL